MSTSGLEGSYLLSENSISAEIDNISPGVYALGYNINQKFVIERIGRSDTDVANRISDYLGDYERFKFKLYRSTVKAFDKECELFHKYRPKDNGLHPSPPSGQNAICPICQ